MNPLVVTAAFFLNIGAILILWKFLFLHAVTLMPDHPARDGLVALAL